MGHPPTLPSTADPCRRQATCRASLSIRPVTIGQKVKRLRKHLGFVTKCFVYNPNSKQKQPHTHTYIKTPSPQSTFIAFEPVYFILKLFYGIGKQLFLSTIFTMVNISKHNMCFAKVFLH